MIGNLNSYACACACVHVHVDLTRRETRYACGMARFVVNKFFLLVRGTHRQRVLEHGGRPQPQHLESAVITSSSPLSTSRSRQAAGELYKSTEKHRAQRAGCSGSGCGLESPNPALSQGHNTVSAERKKENRPPKGGVGGRHAATTPGF